MAYQLFEINSPDDLDQIAAAIDDTYEPRFVIEQLRAGLDPRCKRILLESYYNDKDYRSTYYHYYAKKGFRYGITCVRLHFFDDRVSLLSGRELRFAIDQSVDRSGPSSTYFGYMVLRPTRENTIGRTVISPTAIKGFHGSIIEADHKVHVLGHKLTVKGFPYMSQHMDISVCAHAACWGILRHYSERFAKYAEFLTFDITRMAHEFDPGGLLPSAGLHVGNAERVFAAAGTYPLLVVKPNDEDPSDSVDPRMFYRQLLAYVESGFPLFAEIAKLAHAVSIVGHTGWNGAAPTPAPCHFTYDLLAGLVSVDDNYLPYKAVPADASPAPYRCEDITAFIVPLPDKIYYPAENVDGLAVTLALEEHLGFNHDALGEPLIRYFLTTAAHLRLVVHKHRSQLDPVLAGIVMDLALPQFVWLIEIASMEQWKRGTVETRVIVDATASPAEQLPIFLMHNSRRAYYWDRGGDGSQHYVELQSPAGAPLSRIDGNDGNLETH